MSAAPPRPCGAEDTAARTAVPFTTNRTALPPLNLFPAEDAWRAAGSTEKIPFIIFSIFFII